jgi:branched-chain amino acid transport system substrate-binding protein
LRGVSRRSLIKFAGVAATGLIASPALVRPARAATVVKIGSIQSLTGPGAPPGISARNGSVFAVQEITKAGGFKDSAGNEYSVELISNDMVSDPRQAILMFRQYAADPAVVASIGPTTSLGFVPLVPVAQQLGLPLISNGSGAPIREWNTWSYRINPVARTATPIMLKTLVAAEKVKRLAVLYESTHDLQKADADICREQQGTLGYTLVAFEAFRANDQDFSAQISNIKQSKPDALFVGAQQGQVGSVVAQVRGAGVDVPVLCGFGAMTYKSVWEASNGGIKGGYTWIGVDVDSAEGKLKDWLDSYNKAFPIAPASESIFGYDSVYAVVECVKRTNSTNRTKIRDVLASFKYTSPLGTNVDFQNPPDGDNKKPSVLIVRATGPGKYEIVK